MKALLLFLPLIALLAPPSAPVALLACTQAQHAYYQAPGPDGRMYATWHPLVDMRHGCVHDHEHGSNPALFAPAAFPNAQGTWPLFGYSAGRMGMQEGHAGYKVYVFDDGSGRRWMLTQHQGTANAALAACIRHHTLDAAVMDIASGAVLTSTYQMADFGRAQSNEAGNPALTTACADQGAIPTSAGARQFPQANGANTGYEPWRAASGCSGALCSERITFNTKNPVTACADLTCSTNVPRAANGTWRELTVYAGFGVPGVATINHYLFCSPIDPHSYAYSCQAGPLDAAPFIRNPFISGAN